MIKSDSSHMNNPVIYALKICIISGRNFHLLVEKLSAYCDDAMPDIWISFNFLGINTQSHPFKPLKDPDFTPVITEFRLYGSSTEIYQKLTTTDEKIISIHLCTKNNILSKTRLNIGKELFTGGENKLINDLELAYSISGHLVFDDETINGEEGNVTVTFAVSLNRVVTDEECTGGNNQDQGDKSYDWVHKSLTVQANRMEQKEKDFRCKQEEFNEYLKLQESQLNEKFKEKDRMLRCMIEQEACQIERELLETFEESRSKYKMLEKKLRDNLTKVEAKEHQLETTASNKEAALDRRSAELDLKMKLVLDECEHKMDMEKSKVKQAEGRVHAVEKELDLAFKRVRKAENEVDELHQQLRNSEEAKLHHDVSQFKCKVIELEAALHSERHEKELLIQEKEKYHTLANKLAKLLRQEREANGSLQLERESKRSTRGNDELDELQRIQRELKLISMSKQENSITINKGS